MRNNFQKRGQKLAKKSKQHIEKNLISRFSHVKDIRLLIIEWALLVLVIISLAIAQTFWYKNSYSASTYISGGTYTEATLGKINSMNPLLASTNSEKTLAKLTYLGLTAPDYSGHTGNVLAKSVSMSANGKVWTVKLRDDLKWSDGKPLTNADVLFTVDLIKNSSVTTSYTSNLSGVKVSEESGVLVFSLASPYVDFGSALNFPILPKHIFSNQESLADFDFSKDVVSSGPFVFKAAQTVSADGESVVYLSSNPYYYSGETLLSSFAIHTFSNSDDIVSALNSGSVAGTSELLHTDSKNISAKSIYEKDTAINSGVYAFFNTQSSVFKSKSLRRAVRQGINVEELRSVVGDERPLDYPILSSQVSLDKWPALPEYNLESAKTSVASAGLSSEIPIQLVTISTGYFPALAEDLAEQLRNLGLNVEVVTYEPNQEFVVNVIGSRSYDILLYEISLGVDPDLFVYYHSSQASNSGLNLSNYSNPLADNAILSARETVDEAARNAKYATFLEYWVNDAPAIGIYQTNLAYYFNKNTRSFGSDVSLVSPIDRFVDIKYWSAERLDKNRTP